MLQAVTMMTNLVNKNQTLDQVATLFVHNYAPFVYELSKIIEKQFNDDKPEKKCLCINLICEILRKSFELNCSRPFVKGLAQRLKYFLHSMSRNYVSEGIALQINRNIDSLKYKELFCDEYFQKLQILARKIKENSDPQHEKLQKSYSFEDRPKNYSRTFLSMIRDINKCQSLKPILETYYQFVKLEKENQKTLNTSRSESLDPQCSMRESQDGKGSVVSVQTKEQRKQRLQKVAKLCHKNIFTLQRLMGEEIKKFEQNLTSLPNMRQQSLNLIEE